MTMTLQARFRALIGATLVAATIGCHGILDVSDPTLIRDSDIANASGANAQRLNAVLHLDQQFASVIRDVAFFTDEWTYDVPAGRSVVNNPYIQLDQRQSLGYETALDIYADPHLGTLTNIFWETSTAIRAVRAYSADSVKGDYLAQLYAMRGYVTLQMAEDICPGFPINDVADNRAVYNGPLTTDSAIAYASAQLDSAIKYVHDSVSFSNFAHVVKGRALLDQGKYTEAANMVASIETDAVYSTAPYRVVMQQGYCLGCQIVAMGNREGTNGQPFAAANDPRLPLLQLGPRNTDPNDTLYVTTKGFEDGAGMVLASGIEARLIEAETALHNGQDWKSILDALRARVGLPALLDPGSDTARVSMLYSERAFWLFMTGHRLGDMRRLIKNYGRNPEAVFPTGLWRGGTGDHYGTATAIPFNGAMQRMFNPYVQNGCTSR